MKEFIILFLVLLLIFVPNIFIKKYLKTSGDSLIFLIEEMQKMLSKSEKYDETYSQKLKEEFLKDESVWILLVDHDMLDEIENSVEECVAFFNPDNYSEFYASSLKLIDAIEDLSKREELSFANIL